MHRSGGAVQRSVTTLVCCCSASKHRHAATCLLNHNLNDSSTFFGSEAYKLPCTAVGVESVDTTLNQPIDVAAKTFFIDTTCIINRRDVGRKNPFDWLRHNL